MELLKIGDLKNKSFQDLSGGPAAASASGPFSVRHQAAAFTGRTDYRAGSGGDGGILRHAG